MSLYCDALRAFSRVQDSLLRRRPAMAAMDTDEHHSQATPQTNLRRSNSAPLINGANISENSLSFLPTLTPRHRRSSTSQMANGLPVVHVSKDCSWYFYSRTGIKAFQTPHQIFHITIHRRENGVKLNHVLFHPSLLVHPILDYFKFGR